MGLVKGRRLGRLDLDSLQPPSEILDRGSVILPSSRIHLLPHSPIPRSGCTRRGSFRSDCSSSVESGERGGLDGDRGTSSSNGSSSSVRQRVRRSRKIPSSMFWCSIKDGEVLGRGPKARLRRGRWIRSSSARSSSSSHRLIPLPPPSRHLSFRLVSSFRRRTLRQPARSSSTSPRLVVDFRS